MLHAPSMLCFRSKINLLNPFSPKLNWRSPSKVSMHAQGAHHVTTSKTPNNIDDFYSILGVRHDAQPQEIKTAYRDLIRLLHPDRVEVRQDDMLTAETATDLCVLVNEIYVSLVSSCMAAWKMEYRRYPVTLQRSSSLSSWSKRSVHRNAVIHMCTNRRFSAMLTGEPNMMNWWATRRRPSIHSCKQVYPGIR